MTKTEIRTEMRGRNRRLAESERRKAAERIFSQIERSAEFARAHVVALYCALPDEPPTDGPLARWAAGRRIVVPRVEGEIMRFYPYSEESLAEGAFGIAEPTAGDAVDPAEIDLMIVPGAAFTAAGERLGRGRGYYDRYLSLPGFRAATVGVCFAHQIVGSLPAEPHDRRIDRVVAG